MLTFRPIVPADHDVVLPMVRDFYGGDAVLHPVDPAVLERTFQDAVDPNAPLLRGELICEDGKAVGYLYLTFCYSAEVGGLCVFLEEIYLSPALRGRGLGVEIMNWIRDQYPNARRFRLEVNPGNPGAVRMYQKAGYDFLRYDQMVIDLPNESEKYKEVLS